MEYDILMKSGHVYKPTDDFKDIKDVKLVIDTFKTDDGFIPFDDSMIKISEIAEIYPRGSHDHDNFIKINNNIDVDDIIKELENKIIMSCGIPSPFIEVPIINSECAVIRAIRQIDNIEES